MEPKSRKVGFVNEWKGLAESWRRQFLLHHVLQPFPIETNIRFQRKSFLGLPPFALRLSIHFRIAQPPTAIG